ncbi:reticulon-like protein B8 [Amaranthus tricolor]|uniref:reticulon-like protein B8 n=1 Tax=Amaranthus tricolor TaxID=29722 RepID=UPI0025857E07|nr:reticulon-like protein B8 [Amaranthus tricolor]XP_057525933.1 reticulon-like protein B8 [Amaranthus tricolor]
MPENITAENLMNNILETISEGIHKQNSGSFFEEEVSRPVSSQFNRLFGRRDPLHKVLGGGKSADVLLWRNKKISGSVLAGATATWVIFEWLNYNFLSLVCFSLAACMLVEFLWSNASGFINRSQAEVPQVQLPEEWFGNVGLAIGREINHTLRFLQNIARGGSLKPFILVVSALVAAAIIGSWCNFLTVIYLGFFAAHTLPVLYEKYEDEVDGFIDKVLNRVTHHYKKVDASFLSKMPTRTYWTKKHE